MTTENQARTRNSEVLADFVKYCQAHPYERFWQALRNWSGYHRILSADWAGTASWETTSERDTFNWEGKRHDESGVSQPVAPPPQ